MRTYRSNLESNQCDASEGNSNMNCGLGKMRSRLTGGVAMLTLSAGAAMAQQGVEQLVVTSARLQAAGFNAPTPTEFRYIHATPAGRA